MQSNGLIKNPYQAWDKDKSNYNKRGDDLKLAIDKITDTKLKNIAKDVIAMQMPRGKHKPLDARSALSQEGWSRWANHRKEFVSKLEQLKQNSHIAGHFVEMDEFKDMNEHIVDCYEEYLRMAQHSGRSKTTFIVEDGQTIGKPIIDMNFIDYLKDCLRNINWRLKEDLPKLREREERGLIGVKVKEYDKTIELLTISKGFIKKYLEMPPNKRLIYV